MEKGHKSSPAYISIQEVKLKNQKFVLKTWDLKLMTGTENDIGEFIDKKISRMVENFEI